MELTLPAVLDNRLAFPSLLPLLLKPSQLLSKVHNTFIQSYRDLKKKISQWLEKSIDEED